MKKNPITFEIGAEALSHEMKTAEVLAQYGAVRFLKPVNRQNIHTPDIVWLGIEWELKSPDGKGRNIVRNSLRKAICQSPNIIIDLRRLQVPEGNALTALRKNANSLTRLKRLKVITKTGDLVDLK